MSLWTSPGYLRWLTAAPFLLLTACDGATRPPAAPAAPPPAVSVMRVELRDITPVSTFTGRVEAAEKVELRARVQGFLEQRLFEEGSLVAAGELLFVLEKAPYETAVAQAQGAVASAEAALKLAEVETGRFRELAEKRAVAQNELDQRIARQAEARGALMQSQAALRQAELELGYTEVRTPIAGQVGRAGYSVGNLVGPSSAALATVVSQDPIHVTFPVSQRLLLQVREREFAEGRDPRAVRVRLRLADGSLYAHSGQVDFVDVQFNPSTDTVAVRANMPNPDRLLIDGALVTALVEATEPERRLQVPEQALQTDQSGRYVLVVDETEKVRVRRVRLGPVSEGRVAITSGLEEGERVIVEGAQKVRPDQPVTVTEIPSRSTDDTP